MGASAESRLRPGGAAAVAAAGLTVLLWASAFVGIRHAALSYSAGSLALGRLTVGAVVLGLFAARKPRRWPVGRQWRQLLLCGVAWFGIYNVSLNAAEQHLGAGVAAMLVNVGPILIAVFAGIFLGEGFPPGLFIGGAVAFSGAVVIGLATSSSHQADIPGIALCMAAALTYAVGVVAQKPLLASLEPIVVTFLACAIGAIVCLPFAPALVGDAAHAPRDATLVLIYLGAFPTATAFTTWAFALRSTSAGKMGATTYMVPPLAVLLGWLVLGEVPPPLAFAGGVLCLAGVGLARRLGARRVVLRPALADGVDHVPDDGTHDEECDR